MKKPIVALLIGLSVLIGGYVFFKKEKVEDKQEITARVKDGLFEVFVVSTGELKAKNQIEVTAPGSQ